MGRRLDNDKYTLPAGSLEEDEDPAEGARRELREETGLEARSLSPLTTYTLPENGTTLYCFSAYVNGEPHGQNDPDHECEEWKWIDISEGLPSNIANKLHGPKDVDQNLLLKLFHIQKAEDVTLDESLSKAISNIPQGKEVQKDLHDYNHLLPPHLRAEGYRLFISTEQPQFHMLNEGIPDSSSHIEAIVAHGKKQVGQVKGRVDHDNKTLMIGSSKVVHPHNGRGLGAAGYEAVMAHALKAHGANIVHGYVHNPAAAAVHSKIAAKHNLGYYAPRMPNGMHGEYAYLIKNDDISRLLRHPNPYERGMALLLDGVDFHHIDQALTDEDPQVWMRAIQHGKCDHDAGMKLMQSGPLAQKLAFAAHNNKVTPEHLHALYVSSAGSKDAAQIHEALVGQPQLDSDLAHQLYVDPQLPFAQRLKLMQHPALSTEDRTHALDTALLHPGEPVQVAKAALLHSAAKPEDVSRAIRTGIRSNQAHHHELSAELLRSAKIDPKTLEEVVSWACAQRNPNLTAHAIEACQNPAATPNQVSRVLHLLLTEKDRNHGSLARLMQSPAATQEHVQSLLAAQTPKPEENLAKSENNLIHTSHPVLGYMLGHKPEFERSLRAARFLASGVEMPLNSVRRAFWEHENDPDAAALTVYGFAVTDDSRKALQAIKDIESLGKYETEPLHANQVTARLPEGKDVAESIKQAFDAGGVHGVKLGGKHSSGSLLAINDETGDQWILKPNAGGISPASGVSDDKSTPAARESAFYRLAKEWDLDAFVPRSEVVDIDGKEYVAIKVVPWDHKPLADKQAEDPHFARKVLASHLNDGTLHKWAILEWVAGNPDSHSGNLLVNDAGDAKLIDHGSAFAGGHFDPANDQNSFIPGYLRAWSSNSFTKLPNDIKLTLLPTTPAKDSEDLRQWALQLDPAKLAGILGSHSINPDASVARLNKFREMIANPGSKPDRVVNRLWTTT
jgi:hypothetical protein